MPGLYLLMHLYVQTLLRSLWGCIFFSYQSYAFKENHMNVIYVEMEIMQAIL